MPFTADQFLDVFADYHRAWPYASWLLLIIGIAAVAASFSRRKNFSKFPIWALAVMWFWAGAAYHLQSFTTINNAAYLFGFLFILEGILLILLGRTVNFEFRADLRGISGIVLIMYSMIVYPILGMAAGHTFPRAPSFGLPCPLVIFSLGILLWTRPLIRWAALVIPSQS